MRPFKCIDKKLLPMKMVMFGWFGAYACAQPYMSIHMKELGLTVEETAIIYTLLPVTQFLSSPIAGFIADRLGKYRDVLLLSLVMIVILATALLYVPPIVDFQGETESPLYISCKNMSIITRTCDFSQINDTASILHLSSCHYSNCTESVIRDITWNMDIQVSKATSSDVCEYQSSIIYSSLNVSFSFCKPQITTYNSNCSITCYDVNSTVPILKEKLKGDRLVTFYLYTALRIIYNIFSAIGFTLVNSCAIALTETTEDMGEYGRQRLWAMISMAIFSPIAGMFIDLYSTNEDVNYAPAFYAHNILSLLTCIAVWRLDFEMEEAPNGYTETFKSFWKIMKNPAIFFLLIVIFWLGTVWGFLESFLFWFMIELDSPTYLMGLTVTVGSLVGVPFLYYARYIVSKIGHANILSIAVFMYFIRCIGYSILVDPWWIMPCEVLEIFTYHLMWVAAATYAAHLSPPGLLATIQGFIEGVHFGVGVGSGSLIGGILMSKWGPRRAFQVIGIISGIVAVIYSSFYFFWLKKKKVQLATRKASIKSFGSQKTDRKNSSLSSPEANGSMLPHSLSIQETSA